MLLRFLPGRSLAGPDFEVTDPRNPSAKCHNFPPGSKLKTLLLVDDKLGEFFVEIGVAEKLDVAPAGYSICEANKSWQRRQIAAIPRMREDNARAEAERLASEDERIASIAKRMHATATP
jgi:hypothetical protein